MDRYSEGMRVRREVLGDSHVDKAKAEVSELDRDFQDWITESVWGAIWADPGLDRCTRSLVTIAILAVLGRSELDLHLGAAGRNGVTPAQLTQTLLHVAVYGGVPAANAAFQKAKELYEVNGDGGE